MTTGRLRVWRIGGWWPVAREFAEEELTAQSGRGGGSSLRSRWKRNERGRKGAGLRSGEGVRACALCPTGEGKGRAGLAEREAMERRVGAEEPASNWRRSCAGGEATAVAIGEGNRQSKCGVEQRTDAGVDWGRRGTGGSLARAGRFPTGRWRPHLSVVPGSVRSS